MDPEVFLYHLETESNTNLQHEPSDNFGGLFSHMKNYSKVDLLSIDPFVFQRLYQQNATLLESLLTQLFSEDVLLHCHQLPTYNQDADPFEFKVQVFAEYFDALRRSEGVIRHPILTELKITANRLAQSVH
jgi:hypothetical protein